VGGHSPLGRYGLESPDFADRFRRFMIAIAESVEGITSTNSKPSSAAFCSFICASSMSLSLNPPIGPLEMHHDALGQVQ